MNKSAKTNRSTNENESWYFLKVSMYQRFHTYCGGEYEIKLIIDLLEGIGQSSRIIRGGQDDLPKTRASIARSVVQSTCMRVFSRSSKPDCPYDERLRDFAANQPMISIFVAMQTTVGENALCSRCSTCHDVLQTDNILHRKSYCIFGTELPSVASA